jgi:ABC-type polysaccharide/polyol phosphate transport system ATPase subunit
MKPILEIKNISKKFRIQHNKEPYSNLRDSLVSIFKKSTETYEEFYALNDVSFNVNQGESIGIIGKNGAGKSTLLKILSKITPPSSGSIIARGRIASLLEVGTGFHGELSGRENIFLNGSILGMKQKEIKARFDEIVDFSGTEKFLDTPLKHFSSGMQLRLAFAVAAFLEPEILIIDEVLAVGDAEFQKKCMGKMEDIGRSGRTILFVSHQIASIKQLCLKTIYLESGKMMMQGETNDVISKYLTKSGSQSQFSISDRSLQDTKGKELYFENIYFTDASGQRKTEFLHSEDIHVVFETAGINKLGFTLLVTVTNEQEDPIFSSETKIEGNKTVLKINKDFLKRGKFYITATIHIFSTKPEDKIERNISFTILDFDSEWAKYDTIHYSYSSFGSVIGNCEWLKY